MIAEITGIAEYTLRVLCALPLRPLRENIFNARSSLTQPQIHRLLHYRSEGQINFLSLFS
jgi:hypothetical protein